MPRHYLAAMMISVMLALLLSAVPAIQKRDDTTHISVFHPIKPIWLSEQNLVDLFTSVSTHYNIKRVKWENRALYVDLRVAGRHNADLPQAYRDFYALAYQAFLHTRNVQQLYFRLLEEAASSRHSAKLLVAIQATRPQDLSELKPPEAVQDITMFVEEHFPVHVEPYFQPSVRP